MQEFMGTGERAIRFMGYGVRDFPILSSRMCECPQGRFAKGERVNRWTGERSGSWGMKPEFSIPFSRTCESPRGRIAKCERVKRRKGGNEAHGEFRFLSWKMCESPRGRLAKGGRVKGGRGERVTWGQMKELSGSRDMGVRDAPFLC